MTNPFHTSTQEPSRHRTQWQRGVSAIVFASILAASSAQAQVILPELPHTDWERRLGDRVPGTIALTDHNGKQVTIDQLLDGHPVILALVYYECPMLCNLVLEGLTSAMGEVAFEAGDQFEVLVVSIDPGETVEMAAQRRQRYLTADALPGRPEGWHFLVGDEDQVIALAEAVGFGYTYIPETDEYAHPAGVTLLTPNGVVSSVLFGVDFKPRDLKFALMEASQGTIGSTFDKVILRCFAYNPNDGKYGFAVMATIRAAGIGTLVLLGAFMLHSLRRERRSNESKAASAPRSKVPAS